MTATVSKRVFEKVAALLANERVEISDEAKLRLVAGLADIFQDENSLFDRDRFFKAAYR